MRGAGLAPTSVAAERPRKSVRSVLEWAFGTECARLDFDEFDLVNNSVSATALVCNMLSLYPEGENGKPVPVAIDRTPGRSYPHDDADVVASIVASQLPRHLAVLVADHARAGTCPTWDLGQPRLQPAAWGKKNQHGRLAKTEVCREVRYTWRGRTRVRKDLWTPCVWVPGASEIARKRREYLDWWGALLQIYGLLKIHEFQRFDMISAMPPLEPWKKTR